MQNFFKSLEEQLSCPEALGRILLEMIESGAVAEYVTGLLQAIIDDQASHLRGTNVTEMALHVCPAFTLFVRRVGGAVDYVQAEARTDDYVHTPGRECIAVIPAGIPVTVERYVVSDDGSRLSLQRRSVNDGSPIHEDPASGEAFEYRSEEPVWMLRLAYGAYADVSRFYDRSTLAYAFSSAVRGQLSSLVTLCQVFGMSQDAEALPYLDELARHEAHFVRWAAIQAVGRIDGDRVRQLLQVSVNDDHPQIRQAAARALAAQGGN